MSFNQTKSFPKAILHIDADAFFASCEQALDHKLQGKPVVVGKERGIACAMSYEAKATGVTRGMPIGQVKKVCPDVVIKSGDYESYSLFSKRMFAIIRRYANTVEEYGIDEGFVDITGLRGPLKMGYRAIATKIQAEIKQELNISVSIGLSITKVLAKLASNHDKPGGLVVVTQSQINEFLKQVPVAKVWGIGNNTASYMEQLGIQTAYDFATKSLEYVESYFTRPHFQLWQELNGELAYIVVTEKKTSYASISKTKTIIPTTDKNILLSELIKNLENACIKARRYKLASKRISVLLKTQQFQIKALDMKLSRSSAYPQDIIPLAKQLFDKLYQPNVEFRTTGIVLADLEEDRAIQGSLFEPPVQLVDMKNVYAAVDHLAEKFGKHIVHVGASLKSRQKNEVLQRKVRKISTSSIFNVRNGWRRKRLNIPVFSGILR